MEALRAELGKSGVELHALANGRDDSEVTPDNDEKSISHEMTFAADVMDMIELETALRRLIDKVSTNLRRYNMAGHKEPNIRFAFSCHREKFVKMLTDTIALSKK